MTSENGWAEYSKLVLKELETLASGIKELNDSMNEMKREITEIRAREDKVQELVKWKDRVDEVASPTQLEKLKEEVFYNIASSHLILGNYKSAITNYTKSINIDRTDFTSYLQKGNANWRIKNYYESIEDFSKSIQINSKSYITFNNRGVSKFALGEYKSALNDFKKSLKLNNSNYNTFYNKSLTHFELKEFKKACIDLKKSIKLGKEVFKNEFSKICI